MQSKHAFTDFAINKIEWFYERTKKERKKRRHGGSLVPILAMLDI
jgi:hypothetical protein